MPEFITIEEAARITGFPSQEIQQWAISKKITSYVVKQGVRLVDLTNLREFISHIERMGIQKLYLQLIIQDKEEEINEIISQFDDYLFCLRSLKNISPLLKLIIAELSTFIHDKKARISFFLFGEFVLSNTKQMLMCGKVSQENYVELTAASAIPNKEIKSPQILRY